MVRQRATFPPRPPCTTLRCRTPPCPNTRRVCHDSEPPDFYDTRLDSVRPRTVGYSPGHVRALSPTPCLTWGGRESARASMEWAEGTGGSLGAVKACLGGTSRGGDGTIRPNRSCRVRSCAVQLWVARLDLFLSLSPCSVLIRSFSSLSFIYPGTFLLGGTGFLESPTEVGVSWRVPRLIRRRCILFTGVVWSRRRSCSMPPASTS